MKINRLTIPYGKDTLLEDDIIFAHEMAENSNVRAIPFCHIKGHALRFDDILTINLEIKAKIIAICAYSLEDVELKLSIKDEINFSYEEESESTFKESNDPFELDQYILGIILANVPINVTKKGAALPKSGDGYDVITEQEYRQRKQKDQASIWDKLDDIV